MTMYAKATFGVTGWDEKPFSHISGGPKLTQASVKKTYAGDIEGEGTLEYLMVYHADGSATYTGFERVAGKLCGREGSFVIQHSGTDNGSEAKDNFTVVPNSGTDALSGLSGKGSFTASRKEEQISVTLDFELD